MQTLHLISVVILDMLEHCLRPGAGASKPLTANFADAALGQRTILWLPETCAPSGIGASQPLFAARAETALDQHLLSIC